MKKRVRSSAAERQAQASEVTSIPPIPVFGSLVLVGVVGPLVTGLLVGFVLVD